MMYKDSLLSTLVSVIVPIAVVYGFYVQWHGDYSPGGGFQAGVIIASAFIIYSLVNRSGYIKKLLSLCRLRKVASFGLLIYFSVGAACSFFGGPFLGYTALGNIPGSQHLGMVLIELGVGITVCSSMLIIYFVFAGLKHNLKRI